MAYLHEAPFRPQNCDETAEMLRGLEANKGQSKGKGGFSCKKATFSVQDTHITVDSWRMQDWDYKKPNLPTYARGLFTTVDSQGRPEIAVRGYDKFFNTGEVRETEWANVEANTRGPYELSVKENGCIIFLSGLEDGTLIVCSKHSTGTRSGVDVSHAEAGERWVNKHLARVGKTRRDLAMKLREMNATAVAELCDDEFEEHVLAYTPETAGLYLHGINLNLPDFATYPHHLVDQFADDWGMKRTMYIIKDDIAEVKSFLEHVAETGNYAGRDTEGFVIRCQSNANGGQWHDWFFKYKFEEPYLMYRQWRECTKAIISGREPKYRKHKKGTELYLQFARQRLHGNSEMATAYLNNHGIIKLRDDFLKSCGLNGSDIIRQEAEEGEVSSDSVEKDVVLVPVATIGSGKTTLALALCRLFDWGHVQNDNIIAKKGKPQRFAHICTEVLADTPAMIADRNNHQKRERKQLIEDMSKTVPGARFVCLQYVHDPASYDKIRQATRDRVLRRGDNHQTIHTSSGEQEIISIMEGFMHRFEPVDPDSPPDDSFDIVINLDPCASSRQNLETVITQLYAHFPKLFGGQDMPSPNDMDAAVQSALNNYTVELKHEIKGPKSRGNLPSNRDPSQPSNGQRPQAGGAAKPKAPKLEYFALQLPSSRVAAIVEAMFQGAPGDDARMYRALQHLSRVQPDFHVTLLHRAASGGEHAAYWQELSHTYENACAPAAAAAGGQPLVDPILGTCTVRLERLVWDERVMALVVRLGPSPQGWRSINEVPHITIGTAAPEIKPVESNALLARWRRDGVQGSGIREMLVKGNIELEGQVRGVLQRR